MRKYCRSSIEKHWAGLGLGLFLCVAPLPLAANPCAEVEAKCWRVTHSLLTRSATTADALAVCREGLDDAEELMALPPPPPESDLWAGVAIGATATALVALALTLLAQ